MNPEARSNQDAKSLLGLNQGWRFYAGLILLLLAIGSVVAALLLFPQESEGSAAWTFHIAGMILFAVCVPLIFRNPSGSKPVEPLNYQVVLLGLIIVGLAIFLRLHRLAELPFGTWFDEADIGLRAQQILIDPNYRPAYLSGHALAYTYPGLVALSFKILGMATLSIRLVSALFGIGSVVLAFFLGRELYGNRFGLLMAFFFAAARWSINFSRLGMATSTGPFFTLLVLLLLFRGRRTLSARYFAWAGLAAGIGLGLHTSLRPFPLVILAFLAFWLAGRLRQRLRARNWRIVLGTNLALLAIGALLAFGPLIQVAVREPDDFWRRTREVSLFEKRDEPNLARAIGSNTLKNVLMFNSQGDRNGRHNLPGEPMLDPVTGALFVLGFFLALSRFRRPAEMLFIFLFLTGLLAAILTVDFEQPQAQRAVGAMPAVFFFAALAVEAFWRTMDHSPSPFWARPLGWTLLLAAGAAIVYANTNTYFVRQANDNTAWQSHNATETITARRMRELSVQDSSLYVSMFMENHPTIRFLAPGLDTQVVVPPDILPLREPGDRPVAVLVDLQQARIAEMIDRFYPNAELTVASNPAGAPIQYTVVVPPEDIRRVQGLEARYWPGQEPEGAPEITRVEETLNARWPTDAPLNDPFYAEWSGVLYAPEYGEYQLLLQTPGPARLRLDGELLIDSEEGGQHRLERSLAQGNHALHIESESGAGFMRLAWVPPAHDEPETIPTWALYHAPLVGSRGLLGAFYEGGDWDSEPALRRIDPSIDAYFHLLPLQRPYGALWTGQIEIPQAGQYSFGLEVNGQAQLYIDGQLVVDAPEPTALQEGRIELDAGRHDLRLQFLDNISGSRLHLYWTPPGQERQIVPSEVLLPFAATE